MTSTSWSSAPPPITPINIVPSTSNYITSTSSPSLLPTSTIPPSTRGSYYSLTRHTPRNPSGSIGRTGSVLLDRRSSYLPTTLDGVDLVSSWENVVSPRAHVSRLDGSQGVRSRSLSGRLSEFVNTPLPGAVILEEEEEPVYRPPTASSHAYLKPLIKCVIAYFIAQLWTFVPFLSQTLDDSVYGGKRSAHVIATVMVLLHPGRTIGEMIEADILVVCGLIFSAFICFGSMTLTVYLAENHIHVAHAVVLIILGLTCGLVGYTKVTLLFFQNAQWTNNSFSTDCSSDYHESSDMDNSLLPCLSGHDYSYYEGGRISSGFVLDGDDYSDFGFGSARSPREQLRVSCHISEDFDCSTQVRTHLEYAVT